MQKASSIFRPWYVLVVLAAAVLFLAARFGEANVNLLPGLDSTAIVEPHSVQSGTLLAWDCEGCPM